jgi:hypothetical protein
MNEYIVTLTKINTTGDTYYRVHSYTSGQAVRFKSLIQAEEFGNDQLNKRYSKTSSNVIWFDVVKI